MTKNPSTLASRDRRHANRAEVRRTDEELASVERELREVREEMDRVRAELEDEQEEMEVECCGGACEHEGEVVIDVVGVVAEQLREELRNAVLDDIKMGVAMPIVERYLDDHIVILDDDDDDSNPPPPQQQQQQPQRVQDPAQLAWIRALPPNLSNEEFLRLFHERHQQQPSQRSASSSGGRDDSQTVRSVEGNNSKAEHQASLVPAPGQGEPSTSSLATTPGPLTFGPDFINETDQFLIEQGWKRMAEMSNDDVERKYGTCSDEHHALLCWTDEACRQKASDHIASWQRIATVGQYDCRQKISKKGYITFRAKCPCCRKSISIGAMHERIVAIMNEPKGRAWMAVITWPSRTKYVFEASARCCLLQREQHCVTLTHIYLETTRHNRVRAQHHRGNEGCWCPLPCLDPRVVLRQRTFRERTLGQIAG
jgi:hypothetical protein